MHPGDRLGAAAYLLLLQNATHVVFDCGNAGRQLARDFLVETALLDECENLP